MPTTKDGEKITWKEALGRWKKGIENITPLQKLQNEKRSTLINLIGFVVGLIGLIYYFGTFPNAVFTIGLILIFLGNAWNTGVKYLSLRQQSKFLESIVLNSEESESEDIEMKGGKK